MPPKQKQQNARRVGGSRVLGASKPPKPPAAQSTSNEPSSASTSAAGPSATGNPTETLQAQAEAMKRVGFQIRDGRYLPSEDFKNITKEHDIMDPAAKRVCVRALLESLRSKESSFERIIKLLDEAKEFELTEQLNEFVHQYYQVIEKQILQGLSTSGIVAEAFLPPSEPLQKLENVVKEKREEKAEAKRKEARREGKKRAVD